MAEAGTGLAHIAGAEPREGGGDHSLIPPSIEAIWCSISSIFTSRSRVWVPTKSKSVWREVKRELISDLNDSRVALMSAVSSSRSSVLKLRTEAKRSTFVNTMLSAWDCDGPSGLGSADPKKLETLLDCGFLSDINATFSLE
ncbi:hypothetical protein NDU88_003626 [Pleurodeles waltl]|uniref:Uncharacterized protein n=1 Tax=Pleurodeles waltl TaxID=8319 RepID=A0AAV7W5V1_PLEWA|nr:hypothetical protein NDU88_003626 [Pleurodeles waltl]